MFKTVEEGLELYRAAIREFLRQKKKMSERSVLHEVDPNKERRGLSKLEGIAEVLGLTKEEKSSEWEKAKEELELG